MTLTIRSHFDFQGPNIWYRFPVTHCIVEIDGIRGSGYEAPDLTGWYAALAERVNKGTALEPRSIDTAGDIAATIALIALNLQRIAGVAVDFSFGRPRVIDDGHDVVVQYLHPQVGLGAARLAVRWVAHLLDAGAPEFDLIEEFRRFTVVLASSDHDVSGRSMTNAAMQRGIPQTVVDPRGRMVEFGNGRYRKRVFGTSTSLTSSIGAWLSKDKHLTNHYLREAGLPVPESIVANSLQQALAAARTIGYPVAIKPLDLGASIGVVLDLRDEDDVRARFDVAADRASRSTGKLVVERFVPGHDYRALVVDDTVIGVQQRVRPQVTGDGVQTIRQLIEAENTDTRRGTRTFDVYKEIVVDELVVQNLARLGLSLDDVPPYEQRIELKLSGSRHDGAIYIDLTDDIHPANADLLRTAAKVVGLDVAGIDVIAPNMTQPLWETGGVIIEVNDSPGFSLHLFPGGGAVRDPGPAIMEMLFPPGTPVRVPVVAVAASAESAAFCHAIARAMSERGRCVGRSGRDGVFIDGDHYRGVDGANPTGPRTLLNNPTVEAAVVEVDAESIVTFGLGFDRCDVAVVFSLSGLQRPDDRPVETVLLDALDVDGIVILDRAHADLGLLAERSERSVEMVAIADVDVRLDAELIDRILHICAVLRA